MVTLRVDPIEKEDRNNVIFKVVTESLNIYLIKPYVSYQTRCPFAVLNIDLNIKHRCELYNGNQFFFFFFFFCFIHSFVHFHY